MYQPECGSYQGRCPSDQLPWQGFQLLDRVMCHLQTVLCLSQYRLQCHLWIIEMHWILIYICGSHIRYFCAPHEIWASIFRLSVEIWNFNFAHNFWTIWDRDIIYGMHTQLIRPYQMTLGQLPFDLHPKNNCLPPYLCFTNTSCFNNEEKWLIVLWKYLFRYAKMQKNETWPLDWKNYQINFISHVIELILSVVYDMGIDLWIYLWKWHHKISQTAENF